MFFQSAILSKLVTSHIVTRCMQQPQISSIHQKYLQAGREQKNALCKVSSYHFYHLDNNMFAALIVINVVITHWSEVCISPISYRQKTTHSTEVIYLHF